jgi:predicted regulator of amino acid metabolism with ACT domain
VLLCSGLFKKAFDDELPVIIGMEIKEIETSSANKKGVIALKTKKLTKNAIYILKDFMEEYSTRE